MIGIVDGWMGRWMDRWMEDGWMEDGWMDAWMGGWMCYQAISLGHIKLSQAALVTSSVMPVAMALRL